MTLRVTQHNGVAQVVISGDLTVNTIAEVKAALALAVLEHDRIDIDLGEIEEMDTAGLQLMLMAKRCEGKAVRLVNHSDAVLRLLDLSNLSSTLGDPLLIAGQSLT